MTTYTDTKQITLNSKSATLKNNGAYLSNVKFEFGDIFHDEDTIIHRQIQLTNAQIPYSWYVINYSNCIFRLQLGTGAIVDYNIPVGNYTAYTLIIAMNTTISNSNFAITLNSINGILTFTYTDNFTIYNNFLYSIGTILGFSDNTINVSASNTLTAPYMLNLLGTKQLEIRSNSLSMHNISSTGGGMTTLVQSIPVSCVPFGMIDYTDKGNHLMTIYNISLDDLDIQIYDGETNQLINFNNQDWALTFVIHLVKILKPNVWIRGIPSPEQPENPEQPKIKSKDLTELETLTT